jgi:hypothetical protein
MKFKNSKISKIIFGKVTTDKNGNVIKIEKATKDDFAKIPVTIFSCSMGYTYKACPRNRKHIRADCYICPNCVKERKLNGVD